MITGYNSQININGKTYNCEWWEIKMENTFKVGDYVKLSKSFTSCTLQHDYIYIVSFSGVNQMIKVENNGNVYYKKYFEKVEPKFKINQTVLFDGNVYKVVRTFINDGKLFYFCTDERLVSITVPEEYLKVVKVDEQKPLPIKSDNDEFYYWFFSAQEINGPGESSAKPENILHYVMKTINYFHSKSYIIISYKFVNKNDTPGILVKFAKYK
jgi:hypothetical protein